jgi:hypothetical protein
MRRFLAPFEASTQAKLDEYRATVERTLDQAKREVGG